MFLALYMLFPPPSVLQILNAIPTAFIGGVLVLAITQQTLTVASWSGSFTWWHRRPQRHFARVAESSSALNNKRYRVKFSV